MEKNGFGGVRRHTTFSKWKSGTSEGEQMRYSVWAGRDVLQTSYRGKHCARKNSIKGEGRRGVRLGRSTSLLAPEGDHCE